MTQVNKAEHFKSLHIAGQPVVLYNIWDAGSAKALADAGAVALATGSWSVAAAQGYGDGEQIPLGFALQIAQRIVDTVDVPLTVDFEGGYAKDPESLAENIRQLIATGAIGINFEDQVVGGQGLYGIDEQVARISAIRQAADAAGVPLFINARTDLFLKAKSDQHEGLCADALERESAYRQAGADGFFIPGLTQPELIKQICATAQLPVNVMMRGGLNSVAEVADLGVSRISYGPGPYASAVSTLTDAFKAIG